MSQVTETHVKRTVQLALNNSGISDGTTTRSFTNISKTATAAKIHSTAKTLSSLLDNSLANIYYSDRKLLVETVDQGGN